MEEITGESFLTGEVGEEWVVIAVVAGCGMDPSGPDRNGLSIALCSDCPHFGSAIPTSAFHSGAELRSLQNARFGTHIPDVVLNVLALAQDVMGPPGFEWEREGSHIGVRTDPRITKQVPCAADVIARFKHCVVEVGK